MMEFVTETEQRECTTHGTYEAKKMFGRWFDCPKCSEERRKIEDAAKAEAEKKEAEELKAKRLANMGLKPRFEGKTFDAYEPTCAKAKEVKQSVISYADRILADRKNGESLIFVGRPGTGKTHLASAMLYFMEEHKRPALMLTAMSLIRSIRETWAKKSEDTESEILREFGWYDLLIIDEIGVQYGSEAEKLLFFEVLNKRYENRKPSILMSNLQLDELKLYLGERVFDRLREDGGKVYVFDWESHRGKTC